MASVSLEQLAGGESALEFLSPSQRIAFDLKKQRLSRREIAKRTGWTVGYVKKLCQYGRRRLRKRVPADRLAEYDKVASFRGVGPVRVVSLDDHS